MIGNVIAVCVKMSTKCVPTSPILLNIKSHGNKKSVPGTILANNVKVAGKFILCHAIANAAGTPNAKPKIVEPVDTIKLLIVLCKKSFLPNNSIKLSNVGIKKILGGYFATSVLFLKAKIKVHKIGIANKLNTIQSLILSIYALNFEFTMQQPFLTW